MATGNKNNTVQNHMMSLTSEEKGTRNFTLNWYGKPTSPTREENKRQQLSEEKNMNEMSICDEFKDKWNIYPSEPRNMATCCASFIFPGYRIWRYPRAFYQDLQNVLTNKEHPDQGHECFELIYTIFLVSTPTLLREKSWRLFTMKPTHSFMARTDP